MKEEEALVRVVRVVCGSRNSKGVSVVGQRIFNRETRENREQKGSVPRKPLLHSQKVLPKGIPPCPSRPESLGDRGLSLSLILPPGVAQNLRKFLWPASPCSYRSRCSRFMEFKGSVRYKSNRETRENRESFMVYFSVFVSFALFAVHRIQRECPL